MSSLLDSIAFLSFGLLAVLIPVFVFAVSLLGRAIEKSAEEKEQKENDLNRKVQEANQKIKEISAKIKDTGKTDELEKEIKERKLAISKYERELRRIRNIPKYLTVKGCIISPGWRFLTAFIISSFAKQFPIIQFNGFVTSYFLLNILSLAFFLWGFFIIYQCLNVIQEISLTTDQAQYKRMVEALETALRKHEQSKEPELELNFVKPLPLVFKKMSENDIRWELRLKTGLVAYDIEIAFILPKSFSVKNATCGDSTAYPGYIEYFAKKEDVKKGLIRIGNFTIVAPADIGKFKCKYVVFCRGFAGSVKEFEIEIVED